MLQEFLADLEELQKTMTKLRIGGVESEAELSRQLKAAGIHPVVLSSRIAPVSGSAEKSAEPPGNERMIEAVEAVVRVDVFG